jgi:hypothetical protein
LQHKMRRSCCWCSWWWWENATQLEKFEGFKALLLLMMMREHDPVREFWGIQSSVVVDDDHDERKPPS